MSLKEEAFLLCTVFTYDLSSKNNSHNSTSMRIFFDMNIALCKKTEYGTFYAYGPNTVWFNQVTMYLAHTNWIFFTNSLYKHTFEQDIQSMDITGSCARKKPKKDVRSHYNTVR